MNSIMHQIKSRFSHLSESEKKIGEYILENPEKVIDNNISQLAQITEVSNSTVVRFCQKVGFNGYQQMRLLLTKEIGMNNGREKIPENNALSYIINKVNEFFLSINYLDNQNAIKNAVQEILKNKKIILVASGNTIPLILDFEFRLNRLNFHAFTSTVLEHILNYINNAEDNTILFAISKSGASKSVIDAVKLSKNKGHMIISITGDLNSPLAESSNINIFSGNLSHYISEYHSGIDSHLGEQLIIDNIILLLKVISGENYDNDNEIALLIDKL